MTKNALLVIKSAIQKVPYIIMDKNTIIVINAISGSIFARVYQVKCRELYMTVAYIIIMLPAKMYKKIMISMATVLSLADIQTKIAHTINDYT